VVNLQQTHIWIFDHTLNISLHYLVKCQCQKTGSDPSFSSKMQTSPDKWNNLFIMDRNCYWLLLYSKFCISEDKSLRRMGCMTRSTILPLTLPNVHRFLKFFHRHYQWQICNKVIMRLLAGLSGWVVSASDCGVRGPRFESRRWQLCLSRQPLRYTVLGTGCAPLLRCLGRLSLPPFVGR